MSPSGTGGSSPPHPSGSGQAIQAITLHELPLVRGLFALRSPPVRLAGGKGLPLVSDQPLLAQLWAAGFARLGEDPGRELAGGVGQPWKPTGGESARVSDGAEFAAFQRPGSGAVRRKLAAGGRPAHDPGPDR